MVVALSAAHAQPQEHRTHRGRHLVEYVMSTFCDQIDVGHIGTGQQKTGRPFVVKFRITDFVAGELSA